MWRMRSDLPKTNVGILEARQRHGLFWPRPYSRYRRMGHNVVIVLEDIDCLRRCRGPYTRDICSEMETSTGSSHN